MNLPHHPSHDGKKKRSTSRSKPKLPIMTALIDIMNRKPGKRSAEQNNGQENPQRGGSQLDQPSEFLSESHVDEDNDSKLVSANEMAETTHGNMSPLNNDKMKFLYAPGSQPLPRYTIRRGLGMGGFGEVYFAISDAGKEVALKRIQRNLEVELRGVSHCLNLKHPNLVALYDICHDEADQAWVVMEYVAGQNMRQALDQSPNGLDEPEALRWFTAMAAGVDHLHSAGLVHRDLKPGNIFDDMGTVKVGDYGLSKFISASHRGGHTESVGTFHYMAPEIGRGEYGREIDIYALGIILFELLTGQVPFDGESCHEIIVKHMTALPNLSTVAEPYRTAIAAALHKDPKKRPSTVAELMHKLGLSVNGSDPAPMVQVSTNVNEAPIAAKLVADHAANQSAQPVASLASKSVANPAVPPFGSNQAAGLPGGAPHQNVNPSTPEEPIARAVKQNFNELQNWWRGNERSSSSKTALLIIGAIALISSGELLLPILVMIGIFYVPYYVIRKIMLGTRPQPTYAEAKQNAVASVPVVKPLTKRQWRNQMRSGLRAKHGVVRMAELATSWSVAIPTTIFLAVIGGVIGLRSGPAGAPELAPYGLMAAVGIVSSLAMLLMGKLWEREEGESLTRRITLGGLGAGIGFLTYMTSDFLMLPHELVHGRGIDATDLPQALYQDELPLPSAYMAHFALLFAGLRWWKMVDPLRRRRLSLWSVAVVVVGDWVIQQILPVPQPVGMMLAGGIAIASQMSAPWVNPQADRFNQLPGINPAHRPGSENALGPVVAQPRGTV